MNQADAQWRDITALQYKAKWNLFLDTLILARGKMKRIMNNSNFVHVDVMVDRWCSKKSVEDYILDFIGKHGPRRDEDSEEDLSDMTSAEGREGCSIQ